MKVKTTIIAGAIAIGFLEILLADAQENRAPEIITNMVPASETVRVVSGRLYDTKRSKLWSEYEGKCLKVLPDSIVVQTYTTEPVYEAATTSRATHNYMGGVTGYRTVPTKVQVGTKEVADIKCLLRNYPKKAGVGVGSKIIFSAMKVGTTIVGRDTLELLDCGSPYLVPVVVTNYPAGYLREKAAAAEKAREQAVMNHYMTKAESGDGFAQLRLGELYLRGEAGETNLDLARKWLSAASTNGYPEAATLLQKIEREAQAK